MMEIVDDTYFLEKGFTRHFIKTNSKKMGVLKTRPRTFIKDIAEEFLQDMARQSQKEVEVRRKENKARVIRLVDDVIEKRRLKGRG